MARTNLSQSTKEMPCEVCGNPISVNGYKRKMPIHLECAARKAVINALEISRHSGPGWESYLDGLQAFLARQGRG